MNWISESVTKSRGIVFFALLAITVLLLAACSAAWSPQGQAVQETAPGAQPVVDRPQAADPNQADADVRSKGAADAPITIVEYSDYQCPYCSRWFNDTYSTLLEEYVDTGKVRLVFRDFPLSFHANADDAAVAARCAGEQGEYWQMHDLLFERQTEWAELPDPSATFSTYAAEINLDESPFGECLASGKFDEAIQQDVQAGIAAGVSGTPSFLINGQLLVGAQPTDRFRAAIAVVEEGGDINPPQPTAVPQAAPTPVTIDISGAPAKGAADAPITIVEYSDFQCPFCSRFVAQTWPSLLQQYVDTGKVRVIFKDFPLNSIHPQAQQAGEAARCVRELGGDEAFWAMHDRIFAGQGEWADQAGAADIFARYAGEIGQDSDAVAACLASGRYAEAVLADLEEGINLGVRGTPTFFINGQSFVGAQPFQNFVEAIAAVERGESIVPPTPPTPTPVPTPAPLAQDVPEQNAAAIKGDPSAPVTIVEYSDYQCPFCQRHFLQTMPELQRYIDAGQVRYVFKDFPLNSIHPQAAKAAEAARCAGEQDAYWPLHDLLFGRQQEWANNPAATTVFSSLASDLKLDTAAFDACLSSGRYAAVVQENLVEGANYGVNGTPAFYINRQPLYGAYPFQQFQSIIEAELSKAGQ